MKHARDVMTDAANKYVQEQKASKHTDKELPELKFLYEGYEVRFQVLSMEMCLAKANPFTPQNIVNNGLRIFRQHVTTFTPDRFQPPDCDGSSYEKGAFARQKSLNLV